MPSTSGLVWIAANPSTDAGQEKGEHKLISCHFSSWAGLSPDEVAQPESPNEQANVNLSLTGSQIQQNPATTMQWRGDDMDLVGDPLFLFLVDLAIRYLAGYRVAGHNEFRSSLFPCPGGRSDMKIKASKKSRSRFQ